MKDELREAARAAYHKEREHKINFPPLDIAFDAGYEAGKRAERERIVELLSYISDTTDSYDEFTNQTCDLIRRLKAEPYTEGE